MYQTYTYNHFASKFFLLNFRERLHKVQDEFMIDVNSIF